MSSKFHLRPQPRHERTMEDVNMEEEQELRRLEGGEKEEEEAVGGGVVIDDVAQFHKDMPKQAF